MLSCSHRLRGDLPMNPKLIACRVMVEEIRPYLPVGTAIAAIDIGMHTLPDRLRERIQEEIDASDGRFDPILLGYGLCAKAVVGLVARSSRLVIPKSDDCIEIFLGSRSARLQELSKEPGSFFLTPGYIGDGASMIFKEYEQAAVRYGRERAEKLLRAMMGHYTRIVYIRTANSESLASDRQYGRELADRLRLRYEEMDGTAEWLRAMAEGRWGENFVVVRPGEPIELKHFYSL